MPDLPFELIDYILTFTDASSLYELARVSHALSYLSLKKIYPNHIQHTSLRLWMHQPGTMIHRPIGFDFDTTKWTDKLYPTVEFSYSGEAIPFDTTKSISIDGCTIIFDHHTYYPGLQPSSAKKHYGLTYDNEPIVINPIDSTWKMEKQNQWLMHGELDHEGRYLPTNLSCNISLLNPNVLETLLLQQNARLKERIQLKKQQQQQQKSTISLFGGSVAPSKASCTSKSSLNIISSPSPSKHFTTTSSFTSLSS